MRKVFLSNIFIQNLEKTVFKSDDFIIYDETKYLCSLPYVIEDRVKEDDTVWVITGVNQSTDKQENKGKKNYEEIFKPEIRRSVEGKNVTLEFYEIPIMKHYDADAFNSFFRQVVELLQEGDILHLDLTWGLKPYTTSLFIALMYAENAGIDVKVDTVFYAHRYDGVDDGNHDKPSFIYDITSLYYLNSLAGHAKKGQRPMLDHILRFLIKE